VGGYAAEVPADDGGHDLWWTAMVLQCSFNGEESFGGMKSIGPQRV